MSNPTLSLAAEAYTREEEQARRIPDEAFSAAVTAYHEKFA